MAKMGVTRGHQASHNFRKAAKLQPAPGADNHIRRWVCFKCFLQVFLTLLPCFAVPAQIVELVNITRNENLPATLVCRSLGDPAPDMKFQKIGSPHEFNASNVRHLPCIRRLQRFRSVGAQHSI